MRTALFLKNGAKSQALSGQLIQGCNSKKRALCPKYKKWTRPCKTKNIPIIIITGRTSDTDNVFDETVRPDAYLTKPFTKEIFKESKRIYLDIRKN